MRCKVQLTNALLLATGLACIFLAFRSNNVQKIEYLEMNPERRRLLIKAERDAKMQDVDRGIDEDL
jgi:hypothetical protein